MNAPRLRAACLFAAALAAFLSGCAPTAVTPARAPRRQLSIRQKTRIDRTFYQAVDAYMRADYEDCRLLIDDILRIDPFEKEALDLRRRVAAVERTASANN